MSLFQGIRELVNTQWAAFGFAVIDSEGESLSNVDTSTGLETGLENPGDIFWRKVEVVWAGVGGLNLGGYRQIPDLPVLDVDMVLLRSSRWNEADR